MSLRKIVKYRQIFTSIFKEMKFVLIHIISEPSVTSHFYLLSQSR